MTLLEVPVWDEGIGEYITRRLSIVGCLAHIGDDSSEPKFRLYLSEFGHNGKLKSESLVIVDQNATVNTFPGLVHTARAYRDWETSRLETCFPVTIGGARETLSEHGGTILQG